MKNYYINSNKWRPIRSYRDKGLEELRKLFKMFKSMNQKEYNEYYQSLPNFEYYVTDNEDKSSTSKIKCLNCKAMNINGGANYCPNCGIKFNREHFDIKELK